MIIFTFTHKDASSSHDVTFTRSENEAAPDLVASFAEFMLAAGYSKKAINDAFAEMVTLDAVINPPPLTDEQLDSMMRQSFSG